MKSKYLRDIDCEYSYDNDDRKEQFERERKIYGIASHETWNLDISFIEFIYISFKMYNELNYIDTSFYKFDIEDDEYTMQEAIEYIIDVSETYLIQRKRCFSSYEPIPDKFYKVLEMLMPFMWW